MKHLQKSILDINDDAIVEAEIIIDIMPCSDSSAPNSTLITGHAEPSKESGSPRLINAIYIITRSNENIGPSE